jgi:hypothetical protein
MKKTNLDSLLRELQDGGWTPGLTEESYLSPPDPATEPPKTSAGLTISAQEGQRPPEGEMREKTPLPMQDLTPHIP